MTVKLRIILPAVLLFLVVLAMFGATWLASSAQKDDALVVNLAGRQRMLSQKMAKETLLAASFSEQEAIAGKIAASMAVFERTLAALSRSGQAPLTLDPAGPQRALPAPSAQAAAQLAKVQAQWGDYKARLEAWRGGKREDAAALLAASEAVNKEMDAAVGLMQRESEGRVGVLLWTQAGLALAALLLTLGIVWSTRRTVIDPLQRLIGFAERVGAGDLATCFEGRCDAELDQLRRSLEQMLADLKTKFGFAEGVLGAISDTFPYLVLDKDGRLTHVNRMMLDLLEMGGKPEEYVGQTPGAFFYDEPGRDTRSARAARERTAVRNEMQYRTRKGTDKSILVSANPIQDFDGKPLGLFSFYYDLTQMRRQEEQLGRQRESLAALASQAENLAGMVGQATQALSRNIQSATRDAHGQEEQVEATARSTQDLDRTVQEVARRAQTAADAASGAIRQAGVGEGSVRDVIHSIQDVDAVAGELKRHMQELGGRAGQIGSIITVIQDIADQTNLLALNAAIEAARAGDAGRGFAVVADEVRKLAEKTMTATRDVTEAVSAIQAGIATNTTATDKAGRAIADSNALAARSGDALRDIVQSVQAMAEQLAAIATLARDQAALSSGISRDLQHVQEVSGNTLRGMEESEQAIAGLTARAEELEHIIEALRSEQAKGAQNTAQPALRASL